MRMDHSPYLYGEHADRYTDGWLRTYDRVRQDPATGVLSMLRPGRLAGRDRRTEGRPHGSGERPPDPRPVTEAVVTHGEVIEAFVGADPAVGGTS